MSRIGKNPVVIPDKVNVKIKDTHVMVSGPVGQLEFTFANNVKIEQKDKTIVITPKDNSVQASSQWGTTRALINNMVVGCSVGFNKILEINGVGYKAAVAGNKVTLNLGYSHPIDFDVPKGIVAKMVGKDLHITGADKELVGLVAAKIRSFRPPEPYKGKGIKYNSEHIIRKAGKTGAKA
ncbi:MAG: 50S ribosomal protein L6 [Bdellovibrionales bacterium RIFOXYB1_FULL_37_110]|nr:MAG: 50S ribosomal protein L6 [Bdellovibrionales bacterium RIFOXYA1_FULL_38_20]OFZ47231.1 MAG: 50S ribosomal protein L6 [Bdellovibrionales bacterium RIFOXYC1_FULL_37_79]OFZ58454.1 MAG: 50S ribosomal protein L6 [Bdellovibrionales bacterium RIFOXYB1_FULL_37_110]OFZ63525.1 MAG: 50S ribosomal protein L6 [Bdellovibrionales bacterium RIFOXYD1_FULL_36_51]